MAFKITTPVRRIACLFPEPDPKEFHKGPEEFHKGPREDPLGEGGGRSRMRGEGRRRTWSAPNVEYSAQLSCLCATFDPVEKSIRKRKSWIAEMVVSSTRTAYFRNVSFQTAYFSKRTSPVSWMHSPPADS